MFRLDKKFVIRSIVCVIFIAVIICLYAILSKDWDTLISYCNSTFIAGVSLICFGGLSIVSHLGAFDMFSYMFAKKDEKGVKKPYYEYTVDKREVQKKDRFAFVPYFLFGVLAILSSIILNVLL